MSNETTREVQTSRAAHPTQEIEQTRTGPVFTPAVDIFETNEKITVLADMPGVKPDDLDIDLRENVLTLVGPVDSPESPSEVYDAREWHAGTFYRRFTLSDAIDQNKIAAKLVSGVLRLELPKAEARKPRQIPVSGS